MKKALLISGVVIVVLLLVALISLYLPKENSVEDDKVFNQFGFSLSLPEGWSAEINSVESIDESHKNFSFSFIPPEGIPSEWSFWGEMRIGVYDPQKNIKEWIEQHYPEYKDEYNLVGIRKEDIGGRKVFLVEPENTSDISWTPRHVILGDEYSYIYSFSQDGADGFIERITKEIFPYIDIE